MKTKFFTLLATLATTVGIQAFTIDFNALIHLEAPLGTTVTPSSPLTINIAGYGDVRFEVPAGTSLIVGNTYSNDGGTTFQNSLEFDPGETVIVTFLAAEALNVNFDIIGIDAGENSAVSRFPLPDPDEYQYSPGGGGDGTGIAAISWSVPEPSSSLLVLVGVSSLMLRRRR